ncbi:hypothetical protein [Nesterenkonia sp. PF2B19]|uniref:hypothetical protein n=1 Tax=Nesterenkonia sp. PF2B19 TaxID=1881858 RepID=UPI0014830F50|nr:hypothetical protein [Nesterenkonia sp. PF2B19]
MTATHILDPATVLKEALGQASPDLLRDLLQTMINALNRPGSGGGSDPTGG